MSMNTTTIPTSNSTSKRRMTPVELRIQERMDAIVDYIHGLGTLSTPDEATEFFKTFSNKAMDHIRVVKQDVIRDTAETIQHALNIFIPGEHHSAVIDRIYTQWPWTWLPRHLVNHRGRRIELKAMVSQVELLLYHLTFPQRHKTKAPELPTWPTDITIRPVYTWAQKALETQAVRSTPPADTLIDAIKGLRKNPPPITLSLPDVPYPIDIPPMGLATLYLAQKDVTAGQRRKAIAIDASRPHHDLLLGWRDCPKQPGTTASRELIRSGTYIRLLLPGRSVQLDLPLDGYRTLHDATIHVLRQMQGWEGLRHWAALQRLFAVEGGRRGWVRWTLDGHMNALGYAKRTRESAKRQEAIANQVELLTKIELEVFDKNNKPVSRRPLLLVGEKSGRIENSQFKLDGMILQINPLLYGGVRDDNTKKLGKHWLPGPVELAQIDHARHPYAITLGMLLPIRWRWRLAEGFDHVALTGQSLLTLAGIKRKPNDPQRAWTSLKRDLDKLEAIGGLDHYTWKEPPWTLESVCRLYPPQWVLDRAVRGLIPDEKPQTLIPVTGDDLKAWRKQNHLTQQAAADLLSVNLSSIKRSEWKATERIGPSIRKALEALSERKKKPSG